MVTAIASPNEELPVERGGLSDTEKYWKDLYKWLQDQGYQLRSRYSPDWIPSWTLNKKHFFECEDGHLLNFAQIVDAVYIPDGSSVTLKRLEKSIHPLEEEIMQYFSSDPLVSDPHNHCVRLLGVLHPPNDSNTVLLVMPQLRDFGSPQFDTLGEAVECIRQLFEGLQFMHKHHVAHRDLNLHNFMMLAEDMFPDKHHFLKQMRKPDLSGPARFFTRTQRPPKYFIIDFGISSCYESSNLSPLEPVILGGDRTVPEFRDSASPQNPYQTDIYYAGNLVRQYFLEGNPLLPWIRGCKGFEFIKPLINDMVQDDPSKRPSMDEVVSRFDTIVASLSQWKLRSRVIYNRRNMFREIGHSIVHWRRRIWFVVSHTPAIPRVSQ